MNAGKGLRPRQPSSGRKAESVGVRGEARPGSLRDIIAEEGIRPSRLGVRESHRHERALVSRACWDSGFGRGSATVGAYFDLNRAT